MNDLAWLILVALCVGIFAVVMNSGPKPPRRGGAPPGVFVGALLLLALTGCGASPLDRYKVALDLAVKSYQATDAAWAKQKAGERDACLVPPTPPAESPACVERVIAAWAPRSAALKSLYAALTTAELILEFIAAGQALDEKKPLNLTALDKAVAAALEAGRAVQEVAP